MITLKGNIANLEGTSGDQKPIGVPVNTIFRELDTNCSYYYTGETWVEIPSSGGGGGGGTENYNELENKPQIAGVTLSGNKTLANLGIQGELTFDDAPTDGSSNPVTSDGIYEALGSKQGTLTFDDTPTDGSSNPVTSDGIYEALSGKQDTLTFEGTYNASTNKAATESTVSDAIGALTKSDVGLDNVTNNEQVKAVSGSVTSGGIVTFGADGSTVLDSGKTIETNLSNSNDNVPTSKAVRDKVAGSATMASNYTTDSSEASITSASTINDAIEQLDYRTVTNKTNILLNWGGGKNLFNPTQQSTSGTGYTLTRNADNTFHLVSTGTNSQQFFTLGTFTPTITGTYYLTSGKVGGNNNTAGIYVKVGEGYYWAGTEEGEGIVLTLTGGTSYTVTCKLSASQTLDYLFKPMIRSQGDSTYQPYTISQDSGLPNTTLTPALVECVDNGSKNEFYFGRIESGNNGSYSLNGDTITVTGTAPWAQARCYFNVRKSGSYKVYVKVTSLTTQKGSINVQDATAGTAITTGISISATGTYTLDVTLDSTHDYWLTLMVNNTSSTISSSNIVFTDIMICTEAEYKASQTYQPYALSNAELTAQWSSKQVSKWATSFSVPNPSFGQGELIKLYVYSGNPATIAMFLISSNTVVALTQTTGISYTIQTNTSVDFTTTSTCLAFYEYIKMSTS